ncbi:MAG: hypothetical protein MI919_22905 [Holophagales bacterium]|nr:hypothetical protein [Holophagales bacterium]
MAPFRVSRKELAQRIRGLRRVLPENRHEPPITSATLAQAVNEARSRDPAATYTLGAAGWTKRERGEVSIELPELVAALHVLEVDLVLHDRRTGRELPPELQLTERQARGSATSTRELADELVRLADQLRRQGGK